MIFKIFNDAGIVINRIVGDLDFVQREYANHWEQEPEVPVYVAPILTKVEFRFRFTDAEYTAILAAAKTDVEVQAWYETFNMVAIIDLDNQRTKDGMTTLVSKNLLTQARANEILTVIPPVKSNSAQLENLL